MTETQKQEISDNSKPVSSGRVRFGIILWVISYLPFPLVAADVLHNNGKLSDPKATSTFIAIMWGLQIVIGLIGLYIAGKEAIALVRDDGIKKLPKNLWRVLIGRPI